MLSSPMHAVLPGARKKSVSRNNWQYYSTDQRANPLRMSNQVKKSLQNEVKVNVSDFNWLTINSLASQFKGHKSKNHKSIINCEKIKSRPKSQIGTKIESPFKTIKYMGPSC